MKKNVGFLVFFIGFLLLSTGILYYRNRASDAKPIYGGGDNTNTTSVKKDACRVGETIEYYYYAGIKSDVKNNKFGLYIYPDNDKFFKLAEDLVNKNGGDWGYVLVPFDVQERDEAKWQNVFDQLRKRHLIPVVQLWNPDIKNYKKDTKEAADFLNKFAWPIKQRYISVYNEPNDAYFWFGRVDPKEYAKVLKYTIETFKKESADFFMMNGGFNSSAQSSDQYMDVKTFISAMNTEEPKLFDMLDGWASHSYPQPNFSGSPNATGLSSIKAYDEELKYLKEVIGIKKDLPVFITETGWAHAEGKNYSSQFLPIDTVSEYIKTAYEEVWLKDDRVLGVMPFTIWYESPFDHFSWVNEDLVPYEEYLVVQSMKKEKGTPQTLEVGFITNSTCP